MEAKINIAEILKDKPKGTKLYSPIFGNLRYEDLVPDLGEFTVVTSDNTSAKHSFRSDSRYNRHGEPLMLLPSKEMPDWFKFSWKNGDVLQHSEYPLTVIFESFEDDTYTSFKCKYCFDFESASKWLVSNSKCSTKHFYKVSDEEAKEFIKKVELNYNGKLKMETLEIEPAQPEFKDGDILFVKCEKQDFIEIFNYSKKKNGDLYDHASLDTTTQDLDISGKYRIGKDEIVEIRIATEEEKQQLFSALEKENKAWDAEKKKIVDLKPKVELKPFDKVLIRDFNDQAWQVSLFGYKEDANNYYCCNGSCWNCCIPYKGNEHLLGTTKDVEG